MVTDIDKRPGLKAPFFYQRRYECPGWKAGLYISYPKLINGSTESRTTNKKN
jgi:hypothetical protein